ncbi:hypothetical protein OG496_54075 [Streptomyces sp. NBC_00988]|uniref:hypothetical protein n=1 Tax=Streptomyces sp. NBC_00988 TaxID=2903704 RepID=UPI00386630A7|nr:hypothetical protein OG496_54075 [Streptomyces sp. NBC_00988]
MDNGTIAFHGLGAFGSIVSGNVLAILLGRRHRLLGASRTSGRAMIALGIFGLVSTAAFLVVGGSGATVLIGLVERCGVYPCLIGFVCAGASTLKRRPLNQIST